MVNAAQRTSSISAVHISFCDSWSGHDSMCPADGAKGTARGIGKAAAVPKSVRTLRSCKNGPAVESYAELQSSSSEEDERETARRSRQERAKGG